MKQEYEDILKKFNLEELNIATINFLDDKSNDEYIRVTTPIDQTFLANIKTSDFHEYERKINDLHARTVAAKKAAKTFSEMRASVGSSGIQFTGSPLIVANADWKEYQEYLMWMDQGIFIEGMKDQTEATSLIASEYYKAGNTLIQGGMGYIDYKDKKALAESKGIS